MKGFAESMAIVLYCEQFLDWTEKTPTSGFRPVVVQRDGADVLKTGDRVCIRNDRNHLAFMTVFIDGDRVCISKDRSHLVFMTIFIDGDRVCISKDSSHLVFMTVFIDATSSCCSRTGRPAAGCVSVISSLSVDKTALYVTIVLPSSSSSLHQ